MTNTLRVMSQGSTPSQKCHDFCFNVLDSVKP